MKRPIALVIIMMVILLTAYFTKPTDVRCFAEAKAQYEKQVLSSLEKNLPPTVDRTLFAITFKNAFAKSLRVQDKIIYKAIYQQKANHLYSIGWGGLGMVNVTIK